MITTTQSRLLTAYVDGELSAGQQLAADRLLQQSAEARALLRQMQGDAAKVRGLPRRRLDPGFAGRIVQALPHRGFPMRRSVHAGQRTVPAWVGLAAAASVVLAISAGTYLYFGSLPQDRTFVAHSAKPAPADDSKPDENPADKTDIAKVPPRDTSKQPDETPVDHGPNDASTAKKDFVGPPEPPETATEPALAYPIDKMEMFKAQVADVQQPLILKMRDFEADKLKAEAKRDQAFRLELPSRDSAKAFARIETAFKAHGVTLVIDQVAQKRLKQPKAKTNFVFYVDDLTPEELTAVLKQLGDDDKAAEAKHKSDGLFEAIVVNRMSDGDRKELMQLLGVDPRPSRPAPVDPKKPLSETTADQVAKTIANPASKGAERLAIALAYNPERPRPNSAEVKRFLEGRKPARAATMQVLLVLRET